MKASACLQAIFYQHGGKFPLKGTIRCVTYPRLRLNPLKTCPLKYWPSPPLHPSHKLQSPGPAVWSIPLTLPMGQGGETLSKHCLKSRGPPFLEAWNSLIIGWRAFHFSMFACPDRKQSPVQGATAEGTCRGRFAVKQGSFSLVTPVGEPVGKRSWRIGSAPCQFFPQLWFCTMQTTFSLSGQTVIESTLCELWEMVSVLFSISIA